MIVMPLLALPWATLAAAAPSLCAHLPESGPVAQAGPPETTAPRARPDRSLVCPPGFALDVSARLPICQRAGQRVAPGNPRAACLAGLRLGPLAPVPVQWRPTRTCPGGAIASVIRLEGAGIGLGDVAVASRAPGITLTSLDEDTPGLPPEDRPSARGCFAPDCRLVRLAVASDAPDDAVIAAEIAGGAAQRLRLRFLTHCPDPLAARGANSPGLRGGRP